MGNMFRALQSRNYKLFFGGQTLSLIGTWMESLAMSWLVFRLTGSAFLLGTVAFANQIPMFLVSPFAGVLTDRIDKRRLLVGTQIALGLLSLTLSLLVFQKLIQVWEILVLASLVGIVNAFDMPGRQAFVVEIVEDRDHLANAIALNSTQFNIARLIGPAVAGLTVRAVGEAACFLINAISFLAVVAALLLMRVVPHEPKAHAAAWAQFKEGAYYAWRLYPVRALLGLLAMVSFVSGAYQVLLPVYAGDVYKGDSGTLGYMYSAVGVGALIAALMLASRQSVLGLGRWIAIASALVSGAMALFGLTHNLWLGAPVLAVLGFGAMKHMGSTNTLIQTIVEDRMRGRVMAFYAMSFVGTMPLGSLASGAIAKAVGPMPTLVGAGLLGLLASLSFARNLPRWRAATRPIYEAKGILPSTAA